MGFSAARGAACMTLPATAPAIVILSTTFGLPMKTAFIIVAALHFHRCQQLLEHLWCNRAVVHAGDGRPGQAPPCNREDHHPRTGRDRQLGDHRSDKLVGTKRTAARKRSATSAGFKGRPSGAALRRSVGRPAGPGASPLEGPAHLSDNCVAFLSAGAWRSSVSPIESGRSG